jgi:hypothetical protein
VFGFAYICDIDGEETLGIVFGMNAGGSGAGTAPKRREAVGKWATTTQFTEIDLINSSTGDFNTDTNLSALGTD